MPLVHTESFDMPIQNPNGTTLIQVKKQEPRGKQESHRARKTVISRSIHHYLTSRVEKCVD